MEQKNFKKSLWLGIGIITFSIIVFGVAFYILAGDIGSTTNAIIQGRDAITNQSAFINSYSNLKANVPPVSAYQGAMDQLLVSQDNLIEFPSQLSGVSRNDNVTISFSFTGDPVPATQNVPGYVGFHLDVAGSLSNIIAFLKDMESSAPILLSKIDTFDLSQNGPAYALATDGRVFFK